MFPLGPPRIRIPGCAVNISTRSTGVNAIAAEKTTFRVLAVLLAATLAVEPSALAKGKKKEREPVGARLAGKVTTSDGKSAVAGAVVHVRPLESDRDFASSPTAPNGEYVLDGLPYGYADVFVEASGGIFGGSRIVALPPEGKVVTHFRLTRFEEKSAEFWAGRDREARERIGESTLGLADMKQSVRGAEFWKSPAGIAVIGGISAAVILGIALGGRNNGSNP